MRKLILLLLVCSLCLALAACGSGDATPVSHTFDDLTIQIPQNFIDLSDGDFAQGLDFVFGLDPIAVNGLREEKAVFEAYGLTLDLEAYGNLLRASNNVTDTLAKKDGIWTFTYEANGYTYVVTLWENQDAFWTVQAYCPSKNYGSVKDKMWELLSSVTV